jgi:hypothetical protein
MVTIYRVFSTGEWTTTGQRSAARQAVHCGARLEAGK